MIRVERLVLVVIFCAAWFWVGCGENGGVNGNGSDPRGKPTVTVGHRNQLVSEQNGDWKGPKDCYVRAWITRNETEIRISLDVTDESFWTKSSTPYECDSIEFFFDVRPAKTRGQSEYEAGVFQLILVPGLGKKADRLTWYQGHGDGSLAVVPGTKSHSQALAYGYRIDLVLPLEGFKKNHRIPDATFHFTLGVNDADHARASTKLMWSGTIDNWEDASKFKPIRLGG